MNDLALEKFKSFEISDKHTIESFLTRNINPSSEFSFINFFIWGDIYRESWAVYNDRLIVYDERDEVFFMPVGEYFGIDEMLRISDLSISRGLRGDFIQVPEVYLSCFPEIERFFSIENDEGMVDYIHLLERLFDLSGRKLRKKRNLISQFKKNQPSYSCQPLSLDLLGDCTRLAENWCEEKTCETLLIKHEKSALNKTFNYYEELGMEGLGIFLDDGLLAAFSVFSRQKPDTYLEHFEKSDPSLKGAAQIVNWETARYLKAKAKYLNRESDLGLPGLRQAKRSYDPDIILNNYVLRRV